MEVVLPVESLERAKANMAAFDALYPGTIGLLSGDEAAELQDLIGDAFEHVERERDC